MTLDELKKFCAAEDEIRLYLQSPFSKGEWTYATDGRIAARIPKVDGVGARDKLHVIEELFANTLDAWVPVPAVIIRPDVNCEDCGGKKIIREECNLGHMHEEACLNCNNNGMRSGYDFMEHKTMIGNSCFQDRYLAIIQGWEIAVCLDDSTSVCRIRLGDVYGVLMPIRMK